LQRYFNDFSVYNYENMKILLADSGSTKTDWALIDTETGTAPLRFSSVGLNPCLMSDDAIIHVLSMEVAPQVITANIDYIRFYGAGCRPDQIDRMAMLLCQYLNAGKAYVASDLLGAAHALCGRNEGIVAILGTGSGSAVYDGEKFIKQTPSLGFILGDEGSGAVLGRRLLGDIFKQQLPRHIIEAFYQEYKVDVSSVIQEVYRSNAPSRYLAQFTRFLSAHRSDRKIHELLINEFQHFFARNIVIYERGDLCVNIVGSIAAVFEPEIREAADLEGCKIGTIVRIPMENLIKFGFAEG